MILNHKAAIEVLIEEAGQIGFNPFTFRNLHATLSENLLHDENACGRVRRRAVEISGSAFHPLAMPQVLEDCFHLLLQKATAIPDPFEQAFIDGMLGVYEFNQIDLLRDGCIQLGL